jgi:UDP-GlcNAc:undecaprenyl-phosphate GlcNAc-1-phosphate transferase
LGFFDPFLGRARLLDYLPMILIGFAASLGLTPVTRQFAVRIGLVDKPSPRKVHSQPIPLLGGLAIYLAFMLALLMFGNWPGYGAELAAIVVGASWLALIGFLDDQQNLSPGAKFPAQFLAALLGAAVGIRVDLFGQLWLDLPLTFLWYIGIINAVNFLDNMDGLASGVSAIAAFFLFVLAALQAETLVAGLSAALCGALVGFLVYNFNPATTFMGDMGALTLGYLMAVLGLKLRFDTQIPIASWMIPVLVLGMPIFDTTLVVFTRLRERRSPLQAGKDHTSHRLVTMGLHPRLAVLTLYGACILLGISAILISYAPVDVALAIGAGIAIVAVGSFTVLEVARVQQRRSEVERAKQPPSA